MNKVLISALVVVYNEEIYLEECLKHLLFCDELIVADLGSCDKSLQIAAQYATKIIHLPSIDLVEEVHFRVTPLLKNDLILIIDPDEIMPDEMIFEIKDFLLKNDDFDEINVPWRFLFKNKFLKGTVWGGHDKRKRIIVNRRNVTFLPYVHRGIQYNKETPFIIKLPSKHFIKHYWCDSYQQLFAKHIRYIQKEGNSRYGNSERYSFSKKVKESLAVLYDGLIKMKGILYGPREIFLCLFYSWYIWQSNNSLRHYEKKIQ
jgi:glycosyltransferase involved in cell wall biosynthesis